MKITAETVIGVCVGTAAILVISAVLLALLRSGAFNKKTVKDIASFGSPDGGFVLIFQQLGEPEWPFGKTDVRLTLKDKTGKTLNETDAEVQNDGANAGEGNVKSVEWRNDSVVVILQASEMPDKTVELRYNK